MVKASSKSFPSVALEICTADMQSAYRQVPLAEQDVPASITAIYDPESRQVKLHEMYGQPFGAGHAVPNFYRVAEWFCRLVVRLYGIQCDHFFDDYWIVDRAENSRVSLKCLLETAQLLGIRFDPDKTQLPAKQAEVLGVLFDLSDIQTGSLCIKAKPKRAENLIANIDSCMQSNMLTASQAASIVGKFGFLCSTLFGKAGRCASLGVRARQYTSSSDTTMNPSLTTSLKLMQEFLRICPPRQLSFHSPLPPFVLYSDASDVPERKPRFGVGGVLVDQRFHPKLYHFSWEVPESVVKRWLPKTAYMGQLELLAGPVSLTTWGQQVLDAKLLHFVDNDAASSCLVKGYSPKTDSSELVGIYWLTAAAHRVSIYIDRVESKSNLSDGPSRFDNELLTRLGSLEVKPILPPNFFLDSVSSWFQLPATWNQPPALCLASVHQGIGGEQGTPTIQQGENWGSSVLEKKRMEPRLWSFPQWVCILEHISLWSMGPFWRRRNTHRVSPQLAFARVEWKRNSVLRWYMSGRSEQSNIPVLCAVCILAWMLQSGTTVPFWLKTSLMWVPLFLPKPSLPSTENWGSSVLEKKRMEPRLWSFPQWVCILEHISLWSMGPFWRRCNTHRVSPQLAFARVEWKRNSVLRWYMSGRSEQSNIHMI